VEGASSIRPSLTVPGHAEQVQRARAFIAGALAAHGLGDEVACLLGSELVTNAVRHSNSRLPGGTVTVAVTAARGEVLVAVTDDGGPAWPAIREGEDPCAEDGRGLLLVGQLSTRWGYHRGDGNLTTWFQVPAEPAERPLPAPARSAAVRPSSGPGPNSPNPEL
jgi:anti-sigma regulatory factor (Ser/Thr protein kinase)